MPKGLKITLWVLFAIFGTVMVLWVASILGYLPLTFTDARSAKEFIEFLDSPRDDMRGIKINGHLLDIGKRPSLQILKPYNRPFYMVRPYRKVRLIPLNMTKTEVIDFCLGIDGKEFEKLRSRPTYPDASHVWEASINKRKVKILRLTHFTYLVYGLRHKPVFIGQVELAKKLGIPDKEIMSYIVPVQDAWYVNFMTILNKASGKAFPRPPDAEDVLEHRYAGHIH